jgi:hypothetical protein
VVEDAAQAALRPELPWVRVHQGSMSARRDSGQWMMAWKGGGGEQEEVEDVEVGRRGVSKAVVRTHEISRIRSSEARPVSSRSSQTSGSVERFMDFFSESGIDIFAVVVVAVVVMMVEKKRGR